MEKQLTVIYDDGCPECTVGKNLSEKLDTKRHIDFVGMNTERGRLLVEKHSLDMHSSAYAIRDGKVMEKSRMVRDVLGYNGIAGFFLGLPFRIPWFGDKLYNLLARHRSHDFRD